MPHDFDPQDYPSVWPWNPRASVGPTPEHRPAPPGRLKIVQRRDDRTWTVVEDLPNGQEADSYEPASDLLRRLKRLEEALLQKSKKSQSKGGVSL